MSQADRHDLDERLRHVETVVARLEKRDAPAREDSAEWDLTFGHDSTADGVVTDGATALEGVPSLDEMLADWREVSTKQVPTPTSGEFIHDRLTSLIAKDRTEIERLQAGLRACRDADVENVRLRERLEAANAAHVDAASERDGLKEEVARLVFRNDHLFQMHLKICDLAKSRFQEITALRAQLDAKVRVTAEAIRAGMEAHAEGVPWRSVWGQVLAILEAALPHMIGKVGDKDASDRPEKLPHDSRWMTPEGKALPRTDAPDTPTDPDEPEVVRLAQFEPENWHTVSPDCHDDGCEITEFVRLSDHQAAMKRARVVTREQFDCGSDAYWKVTEGSVQDSLRAFCKSAGIRVEGE